MEENVDDAEIDSYIKKPGDADAPGGVMAGEIGGAAEGDDEGEESDPNAFEVESIKAVRKARGKNKFEYKVKWKGYGSDDDTWEPRENMQCDEILKAFENSEEGKRMFAECQAGGKRGGAAAKPAARAPSKSTARILSVDDDDDADGDEEDWSASSNNKKRKAPAGGAAAGSSKPAVRRRYADDDDESEDDYNEAKTGRGRERGGIRAAKTAASSISATTAPTNATKSSLPTDKVTENFLKNDSVRASSHRLASGPKQPLDETDYDALARVGVAAVRQRNDKAAKDQPATRVYGEDWKRKTISDGVRKGYVLRDIIAAIIHKNELVYLVDWKNTPNIDLVEHEFLLEFYPREVFDYVIERTEMQSEDMLNFQQHITAKTAAEKVSVNGFKTEDESVGVGDDDDDQKHQQEGENDAEMPEDVAEQTTTTNGHVFPHDEEGDEEEMEPADE